MSKFWTIVFLVGALVVAYYFTFVGQDDKVALDRSIDINGRTRYMPDFAREVFRAIKTGDKELIEKLVFVSEVEFEDMLLMSIDFESGEGTDPPHMTLQKRQALLSAMSEEEKGAHKEKIEEKKRYFLGKLHAQNVRAATHEESFQDAGVTMDEDNCTAAEVLTVLRGRRFFKNACYYGNQDKVFWDKTEFKYCLYASDGRLYIILSESGREHCFSFEALQLSSGWVVLKGFSGRYFSHDGSSIVNSEDTKVFLDSRKME